MRHFAALLCALGLLALAVRCGDDGPPALLAVDPSSGPNDRPVAVLIVGRGLAPLVGVDVGCNGKAVADARFDATLDAFLLDGVAWQSNGNLAAAVPAGLAPGQYDLHVHTPAGADLSLARAYQVLPPGGGGDAGMDAPGCSRSETLYASAQVFNGDGSSNNENLALGAPDGQAGTASGALAATRDQWTFSFPASTLSGPVRADVSLVLWVTRGYVDDRMVIEASGDRGLTWSPLVIYGLDTGLSLPRLRALAGPFSAPDITSAPASGQAQVRIRGDGTFGPRDTFTLHVDSVALQLCQ